MTRHSPSEAVLGEIPVSGLHANFTLLSAFNDAVGKEVLLELVDGSVFTGIFGGASSEMEVGLYCAYEKTAENEKNLLPLKKEIVQKRQFAFSDIVCVTVPTSDEKMIRGFATDRDYHTKKKALDDEDELEEWEGDGEDVELESEEAVKAAASRTSAARNGGWSVNDMFAANQSLGVKTTFEDNLSQYTTAEVEGTEEDRRRAEEIARQIEKSGSSRMYSALENDDEERDLDKITDEADLLGYETKNKNWSNGSPTSPLVPVTNEKGSNGVNGSGSMSCLSQQNGQTRRPPSLMNADAPPGFPPPGFPNGGFTTVLSGRGRKGGVQSDHSHNTYLPLANRNVNNNVRGGSQLTPKNNRADALKGEGRRTSSGGVPPTRGALPSPKGQTQGNYVKRESYEGAGGGGQAHGYDSWNKGGMKTFENTKMKDQNQKMMLENRNASSNSPRNTGGGGTGGTPSGPATTHNQKGGTSGRVEGLKAWQNDFNPSFRESRPTQKGSAEKVDSQPQTTPVLESAPPTKNAWQSGPPSGLTSSSRSEESKNAATPSPSNAAPTPAEMKMNEEREESKEEATPSTSHEEEKAEERSGSEKKEDADVSKDSCGNSKKFSFNPDAPAFTPKFGGATSGMAPPSLSQTTLMVQSVPMAPNLMTAQGIPMQAPMGMQPQMTLYPYPTQPHFPNMQQNMQYSAVVNGGAIMAGAAQNGQGQTGGAPSTPRGANGGQGTGMGSAPRQRPGTQGSTGAVPVTMTGQGMYMQPGVNYQHVPATYMQSQPNYYAYNAQPQMIQAGTYAMPMSMPQQGMMGQQRNYLPQQAHPSMMMQYNVQQQYGGGPPPGVTPHGGGTSMGSVPQGGGGGSTPSASTTNGGPPSNGNGAGQGGASNAHPPSQPPTPGAVPSQNGGVPPQGTMMPQGGPPGMAPPPVPSPGMYGMQYGGPGVMYYNQGGAPMGGMEMHGGEGGAEAIHTMQYQYNPGQYYQNAPPHLRAAYSTMSHGMQQQPQHAPAQPSQSQN
ncbi:hypothetical protein PMAYCL1PPCAC_12699 [Pristionchus mayeri]|uniref:LsmAD domain-containing protein n=1 Tax=Pristionchus mayeri TaxID=1317129 RepID=A0AAN4ZMC1_9BILA|nr:hypothetical protein PMAYCL1PPCAC_12699 [Pristionchus mayeri]